MTDYGKLLWAREVASVFGVDPRTIARWADAGILPSTRTDGGHRRFLADDVRALLQTRAEIPDVGPA